jgi:hypothetical protein
MQDRPAVGPGRRTFRSATRPLLVLTIAAAAARLALAAAAQDPVQPKCPCRASRPALTR